MPSVERHTAKRRGAGSLLADCLESNQIKINILRFRKGKLTAGVWRSVRTIFPDNSCVKGERNGGVTTFTTSRTLRIYMNVITTTNALKLEPRVLRTSQRTIDPATKSTCKFLSNNRQQSPGRLLRVIWKLRVRRGHIWFKTDADSAASASPLHIKFQPTNWRCCRNGISGALGATK